MEEKVATQGNSKSEAGDLTGLFTPANVKDFTENNIGNLLNFINGKYAEIVVYVPIDKIPKSLISTTFYGIEKEMPLSALLTELGITGINSSQIEQIKIINPVSTAALLISLIAVFAVLLALFKLTDLHKRYVFPGLALFFAGLLLLIGSQTGQVLVGDWIQSLPLQENLTGKIPVVVLPTIISGITKLWILEAILGICSGLALFFIGKKK